MLSAPLSPSCFTVSIYLILNSDLYTEFADLDQMVRYTVQGDALPPTLSTTPQSVASATGIMYPRPTAPRISQLSEDCPPVTGPQSPEPAVTSALPNKWDVYTELS